MGLYDVIFKNAYKEDAAEAEKRTKKKYPLLLHKSEHFVLAFKDRGGHGRDKHYFTTHRILLKDGKGVGSKRKNYKSIPYSSIQAFAVDTSGKMDGDVSLQVWSSGIPYIKIDLAAGVVDIFEIQQFLNVNVNLVKTTGTDILTPPPNMDKRWTVGRIMDWMGDNAKQTCSDTVRKSFTNEVPVLLDNEVVEIAFISGRDYTIFTDRRVLIVDVQGVFGKKIVFTSILWSSIKAYSIQTAGALFDRDTQLTMHTNILNMQQMSQDLCPGADVFGLQRVLCNHILGKDSAKMEVSTGLRESKTDHQGFSFFKDSEKPLDAKEIDEVYHSSPQILRSDEHVEMAFKGEHDVTLFTNFRIIIVDPQGLMRTKVKYTSIPWTSVVGHSVKTAGEGEFDGEVGLYTEMVCFDPGKPSDESQDPTPASPLESYITLDFKKDVVNMNELNYYLSRRLLLLNKTETGAPIAMGNHSSKKATMVGKILDKTFGNGQREIDPSENMSKELLQMDAFTSILLNDEKVLMAFKAGSDVTIFTNLRIMNIDKQALYAQQIEYISIPYKSIRAWSVETAGVWDTDTVLRVHTKNRWDLAKVQFDFGSDKADIQQINRFLSALIVGKPTDSKVNMYKKNYKSGKQESHRTKIDSTGIKKNCYAIDAKKMDAKYRTDPAILLDAEKVLKSCQSGRDVTLYTDRRIITIDIKGLEGKATEYKSIPLKYIHGLEFETAGNLDNDAEIMQFVDVADVKQEAGPRVVTNLEMEQCLLVKDFDIYEIASLFLDEVILKGGRRTSKVENGKKDGTPLPHLTEEETQIDMSHWG